jgi:protein O-mannosyl-transferase
MAKRYTKKKMAISTTSASTVTTSVGVQEEDLRRGTKQSSKISKQTSWFRVDWFWGLMLMLAVILVYAPVWKAGFVWDDQSILTANPCIVGPLGLKEIWTTSAADICPLTLTTFWVEHALWGLEPLPYHLVNVLLHAACAILLWRVLRNLRVRGAWLGAALWAIHPVEVESVAWVTEMKNTESGLFFLLSVLFFTRWLRAKGLDGRTKSNWDYVLTLLFAALAMATKSSTVILPVVLCLCAWWMDGRWHWRKLTSIVPVLLMAMVASAISMWTQRLQLAIVIDPLLARTWAQRLATAGDAVWFYLGKLLWPHPLMTVYPRWQIDAGQWVSYLGLLAAIIILFIFWLKREGWSRNWFFAFAYFMAALLPVLGLIDNSIFRYSLVFDHLQYLPSIGPLALVGAGLARFADFIPKRRWLQPSLCAGLLLILGMTSWHRTRVYEREETLWTDAVTKNPNCWVGYNNLGLSFFRKRQLDEAVTQYQKALQIYPNYADGHSNLGYALVEQGQLDKGLAQFQKAVEINPSYSVAHGNLGAALFQKGQLDEAIGEDRKALEKDPNYDVAHNNLGQALLQKGQPDDAIAEDKKALEIRPNYAAAHNNLGQALLQKGQLDEAIGEYQKALEIQPGYPEAHGNLGLAFFQKGQLDEAIDQYKKALQISPNYVAAHYNFGLALFRKGQLDEAIAQFQRALEIQPSYEEAHVDLGDVFSQEGKLDEAIDQFQKAVEINPNDAEARYNLGNAFLQQERLDEAIDQFKKALEMNSNSFEIHYSLGAALGQKGKLDEAIEQFQEVLRMKPDFRPAQDALEKVQAFVRQREGK